MAEWLGRGLQNLVRGFDSRSRLQSKVAHFPRSSRQGIVPTLPSDRPCLRVYESASVDALTSGMSGTPVRVNIRRFLPRWRGLIGSEAISAARSICWARSRR